MATTRDRIPEQVIVVADGFWNIRGSFKVGPIDLGTHASLVRRPGGSFVLLDACAFDDATGAWLDELTSGGARLEAMIHLHPFHTLHVTSAHERFPGAKLYGTARHVAKLGALPWQPAHTEDPAFHQLYADDFEFSVPRGVDFIPDDPKLHFSSVLAFHKPTRTLHVDDTLVYVKLPWFLRPFGRDVTRLHPALAKVLERRPGAADAFRDWTRELVERAREVDNLCAAHSANAPGPHERRRADRRAGRARRTAGRRRAPGARPQARRLTLSDVAGGGSAAGPARAATARRERLSRCSHPHPRGDRGPRGSRVPGRNRGRS